jgi:transposase
MRTFFFKTHKKFTTNLIIFFILPQLSVNLRSFVVPLLSNVNFTRLAFFSFFTSSTSSELLNSEYSWGIIKNTLKKVQKKSLRACILNSSFVHKKSQHHYKKD